MENRNHLNKPISSPLDIPEMVLHISEYLPIDDLLHFLGSCTFFYNDNILQPYKIKRLKEATEAAQSNLKDFNCDIRKMNMTKKNGMALWENLVVIFNENSIKVWNLNKNALLWTGSMKKHEFRKVWVDNGKIICYKVPYPTYRKKEHSVISILDVHTGNLLITIDPARIMLTNCRNAIVNENQIITQSDEGKIQCWDLSGQEIKSYQSYSIEDSDFHNFHNNNASYGLLANSQYIIDLRYNEIRIFNRKNSQSDPLFLTLNESISAVTIKDNLLICGLSSGQSIPEIVVIDMVQGIITRQIKVDTYDVQFKSIVANDHFILAAHNDSSVIAVDWNGDKLRLLKDSSRSALHLQLHNQYLFMVPDDSYDELHIWKVADANIEKIEEINRIQVNAYKLKEMLWSNYKILLLTQNGSYSESELLTYDFTVRHQQGAVLVNEIYIEVPQINMDYEALEVEVDNDTPTRRNSSSSDSNNESDSDSNYKNKNDSLETQAVLNKIAKIPMQVPIQSKELKLKGYDLPTLFAVNKANDDSNKHTEAKDEDLKMKI